ncbi:glycoside hydrolase, family 5 [Tanacetum coccineum]
MISSETIRFLVLILLRFIFMRTLGKSTVTQAMQSHVDGAGKYVGMPVVFSEFGVFTKDPSYSVSFRDNTISIVYNTLLDSVRKGESGGGCLLWQVFPDETEYMDDGYAIILFRSKAHTYEFFVQMEMPLGVQEEAWLRWVPLPGCALSFTLAYT